MGFWVFISAMLLLIPLSMIVMGSLFMNRAPKKINCLYGYRTTMSMKNRDTWEFAHRYFGRIAYLTGWGVLAVSVVIIVVLWGQDSEKIGWIGAIVCSVQCIPLLLVIYPTEKALRYNFDKDGNRKPKG